MCLRLNVSMKHIHPKLYADYQKWLPSLGEPSYPGAFECLSTDEVLRAHYLLCDYFVSEGEAIAAAGPRDKTLFLSAIDRQVVGFGDSKKWTDPIHIAASLFYGLVKNHPFHDGNKRTGLLCTLHQLIKNKRIPVAKQRDFERLAVDTASGAIKNDKRFRGYVKAGDPEVRIIAHYLRKYTRLEDKRLYVITFNQLKTILAKHGFMLEGPDNNHVDIVKYEVKTSFLGLMHRKDRRLVAQVGCPRMTAEVNQKALKTVLRQTGLTPENGYDSQVVFKEADPLTALIEVYREPLRRLRDK